MIEVKTKARESGTMVFVVSLKDEDGAPVTPNSFHWSLVDDHGAIINSRNHISKTPGAETTIVLSGADLALSQDEQSQEYVRRWLVVEVKYDSTYGTNLPENDAAAFLIRNIPNIPNAT
jgi:hypothetical protein